MLRVSLHTPHVLGGHFYGLQGHDVSDMGQAHHHAQTVYFSHYCLQGGRVQDTHN